MSLGLIILLFIFTDVMTLVEDTDNWQGAFFVLVLASVVVINICGATFQGGLLGLVGKFPPQYIGGTLTGQVLISPIFSYNFKGPKFNRGIKRMEKLVIWGPLLLLQSVGGIFASVTNVLFIAVGGDAVQGAFYSFFIAIVFLGTALAAFLYVTRHVIRDVHPIKLSKILTN